MSIRIPQNVDLSLQNCLRDIERALNELKSAAGQQGDSALQSLRADVDKLTADAVESRLPDDRKVFVASGPMHSVGLVPDPGATAGTAKLLREDGTWQTTLTSSSAFSPSLGLTNTNADSSASFFVLRKDSASPAIGDNLGTIQFQGDDSNGTLKTFAIIVGVARAVTAGGEQGRVLIYVYNNGTAVEAASFYHDSVYIGLPLDINSDTLRLRTTKTPAAADATGTTGDICWDASYFYICIATNTWHRVAHATWA